MSFLKKIWFGCCQDVPSGSTMAVPVVVHNLPEAAVGSSAVLTADCRQSALPRKHFSSKDASVHCLCIYISWVS